MRTKIKLIAVLLILLSLVYASVGCTTTGPTTTAAITVATTTTASQTQTQTSDNSEGNFKLGLKPNGEKFKVGVSVLDVTNTLYADQIEGMKKAFAPSGAELIVADCQNNAEKQVQDVENFITAGVDGILMIAVDPVTVLPSVQKARSKGIKIITNMTKLNEYDAHISADAYRYGELLGLEAGKWIKEKLGGQAKVGMLEYNTIPEVIIRQKGMEEGMKKIAPDAQVVARKDAGAPEQGMKAVESFLQAYPDMKVVMCINDGGALGAYEAIKAAKKDTPDFFLGGTDGIQQAYKLIKENGLYNCTVSINPEDIGFRMAQALILMSYNKPFEKDMWYKLELVNFSNVDKYLK